MIAAPLPQRVSPARGLALCRLLCLVLAAAPAGALELEIHPSARLVSERPSALDNYRMPVAAFDGTEVPSVNREGRVLRQSWRIDSGTLTTLQILAPIREQLEAQGFRVLFQCEAEICGGFDFRFGTEVIPAPDMYVDIRRYRYLAAERDSVEAVSIMVSRSRTAGFVQIIQVSPVGAAAPATVSAGAGAGPDTPPAVSSPMTPAAQGDLLRDGRLVLDGLDFGTGADALAPGTFPVLDELAALLRANPGLRIALVGHTDSVGSLQGNIDLSRRRAAAVRARLIDLYNLPGAQIDAEGMGYLAPVASNLTPEGRATNRRVEAIVLSDDSLPVE